MSSPEHSPIAIPDPELDDLRRRLLATRWPDAVADDWQRGTAPSALKRLVTHWAEDFDWRAAEERLNSFDPVMVGTEGHRIHALRAGTRGATPLLLIHGWPDGPVRFLAALPLLASRFDIVVPSVPGFGFSDHPHELTGPDAVARRFGQMMSDLGFERFAVHGADVGAHIAEQMAMQQPDRVSTLHFGNVPSRQFRALPLAERDDAENKWFARAQIWDAAEGAYGAVQSTKPPDPRAGVDRLTHGTGQLDPREVPRSGRPELRRFRQVRSRRSRDKSHHLLGDLDRRFGRAVLLRRCPLAPR